MRLIKSNLLLLTSQSLLVSGFIYMLAQSTISTYGIGTIHKPKTSKIPNFQYSYPILNKIYDNINHIVSDQ